MRMRILLFFQVIVIKIKGLKSSNLIIRLEDVMSNQANGSWGSTPFVQDKQFQNLSLDEIRQLIELEKEGLKKDYKELVSRKRLIKNYKNLVKARQKVNKGIDIKKEIKKKSKAKKPATYEVKKPATSEVKKTAPYEVIKTVYPKMRKVKTFDEYFEECIKNREIPKDTPSYLREALERAIFEHYDLGLKKEKSAFENFVVKYIIDGEPGLTPVEYFNKLYDNLENFLKYHRNIKFGMVLICLMEQQILSRGKGVVGLREVKAYFGSGTHINLESTDVNKYLKKILKRLLKILRNFKRMEVDGILKKLINLKFILLNIIQQRGLLISLYLIGYQIKKQ